MGISAAISRVNGQYDDWTTTCSSCRRQYAVSAVVHLGSPLHSVIEHDRWATAGYCQPDDGAELTQGGASMSVHFKRRRPIADPAAELTGGVNGSSAEHLQPVSDRAIFRNFSVDDFCPTESWRSLEHMLDGNGGCFGVYGPRGSGKSWLMHRVIAKVESKGGLGLWFPCPRKYDASDFLFALSDNLASAVERRLSLNKAIISALDRIRNIIAIAVAALLLLALILYGVRDLAEAAKKPLHGASVLTAIFPAWLWILIATAAILAIIESTASFIHNTAARGSLLHEATALRERIRFTESLKRSVDFGITASYGLAPSLSGSRERELSERPTSIASLVFDFRNLAAHIVDELKKPLVVCIDELDKIEDTAEVRLLLRDIKGIFEVDGTLFLVSISEEAAASLQLGTLQSGGRNELNSSFYSVFALSPLGPDEADQLLSSRGLGQTSRLACALCLLAGGNRRELIRMADSCATYSREHQVPLNEHAIIALLAEESLALLQEITRSQPETNTADYAEDVKYRAWMALPRAAFHAAAGFTDLGGSAIREFWEPEWANEEWSSMREPWRRLLVRLFVAARVLPPANDPAIACLLDDHSVIADLQDTLVMAARDSGVARLMLLASFGSDLSDLYRPAAPRGAW